MKMSRYRQDGDRSDRDRSSEGKIYIGDLARDTSEKEIEKACSYYGPIRKVWIARNPAGFAFVEYEDARDADDAVRGLDGTSVCGSKVRVEHSTGKVRPKPGMSRGRGPPPRGRRPFNTDDRCYECGGHGHYAYDCDRRRGGGGGRKRRSRSKSRSRSRSRSYDRRSYSRSRSRSKDRGRSRSKDRFRSASK